MRNTWEDNLSNLLDIAITFAHGSAKNHFYFPFYGTYSPPNISGRVLSQNSIFVCQLHHTETFHANEPSPRKLLLIQHIKPDITIEIANKKMILKELDTLGINLKTVFGDYDSIAKYIKNSFYGDIQL